MLKLNSLSGKTCKSLTLQNFASCLQIELSGTWKHDFLYLFSWTLIKGSSGCSKFVSPSRIAQSRALPNQMRLVCGAPVRETQSRLLMQNADTLMDGQAVTIDMCKRDHRHWQWSGTEKRRFYCTDWITKTGRNRIRMKNVHFLLSCLVGWKLAVSQNKEKNIAIVVVAVAVVG